MNCSDLSARMVGRKMSSNRYKYSLEARKAIYSRPLKEQFELVFKQGEAAVMKHIIKSSTAEDYGRVLDVAKAFAIDKQTTVYILPEINAREKILRGLLGLRTDNGYTPDIMFRTGNFADVKSPKVLNKLSHNAGKASRQSAVACITDHRLHLSVNQLDEYAKRVFGNDAYDKEDVYFYIDGRIYIKTKG